MNTDFPREHARRSQGRRLALGLATIALAAPLVLVPFTGVAHGGKNDPPNRSDHEAARRALLSGEVLSLRQVLDIVAREYPGEPVEIEFEHEDGMYLYELKLLQATGRIIKMKVDASTGAILSVKARGKKSEDDD